VEKYAETPTKLESWKVKKRLLDQRDHFLSFQITDILRARKKERKREKR